MAETKLVLATSVKWGESAKKTLDGIKGSLDGIGESTKSLGSKLTSVGGSILKFGAIGMTAIWGLGALWLKMAGDYEQTATAFKTMLGDWKKASALLEDLSKFAAETPFEFTDIANAGKSLLAFGIEAWNVRGTLTRLGDVASSLNVPLGEISEIYGKARVQGRLFSDDINQLTGRGIPIIQELANVLGTTEGNIKNMVEKGKVGFPELEKAFQNMTNEGGKFAWGMKNQSLTLNGLLSTAKDGLGQLLRELIGINVSGEIAAWSILDKARVMVTAFIAFTNENSATIKAFLQALLEGFSAFFATAYAIVKSGLEAIKAFWAANWESITATVRTLLDTVSAFWKKHGDDISVILWALRMVFEGAWVAMKSIVESVMMIIGPLTQSVMTAIWGALELVAGILSWDFSKAWQWAKDLIVGIIESLSLIVLGFVNFVAKSFWIDIVKSIDDSIKYLSQKANEAKAYVSSILESVGSVGLNAYQGVSNAISGARADGGPVTGGSAYLVGERGPEIFTPSGSGQIIPNDRIGRAGGGITINITGMFWSDAAEEISQHIVNRLKGASYI